MAIKQSQRWDMKKPLRCLKQPKGQKEPHDGGYEIPAEKTESGDSASCGIRMTTPIRRLQSSAMNYSVVI